MRLVADLEKINSNLTSLSTEIDGFSSDINNFNSADINCSIDDIKLVLNDYKSTISNLLEKLDASSKSYKDLVDSCIVSYIDNEDIIKTINVDSIKKIISNFKMSNNNNGTINVDTGNPTIDSIYNYLANKGFNNAAICGILANMDQESRFDTNAVGDNGSSYGLCQWHNERWASLNNYCSEHNLDPSTVQGQLEYLCYELETSFPTVYETLKNVDNSPQGAYDAAYIWTTGFEIPQFSEIRGNERGNAAQSTYWDMYSNQ